MKELTEWQRGAVEFGQRGRWLYGDAPGAGKTGASLVWLDRINARRSLVVAPLQVRYHWAAEAEAFGVDIDVFDASGTPAKRKAAREAAFENPGQSLLLYGYEAMRQDREALVVRKFDAMVADESHRLKNRQTAVTKMAGMMARRSTALALLSGTFVLNRADDLWAPLNMLDHRRFSSYWRWVNTYHEVELTDFHGKLDQRIALIGSLKAGAAEAIRETLADVMIARPLSLLRPDIGEPIHTVLAVELSAAERKMYDHLQKKAWIELGDGRVIVAPSALTTATRSRQIASDWSSLDPELGAGAKVKATLSLIADLAPEQVVVMAAHRAALDRLAESLGPDAVLYTGETGRRGREEAVERFQSGDARVFLGMIQAAGEGLDGLQVAQALVLLDRWWNPPKNDQAIGRLLRGGQTGIVRVYHVVLHDTVDEDLATSLAEKREIINAVLPGGDA